MLSTKDLAFKERPVKKLMERYVGPYEVEKVVLRNAMKLKLPVSMRIYLVLNISRIERYREPVRGQKVKEPKPVEVDEVEEWKVEKILNKRKVQGIDKYLVRWKGFTVENNTWEKEEDLKNAKELVNEFERRLEAEVKQQEGINKRWKIKLNPNVEEFKRSELPEKYIAKILYG